MSPDLFDPLFRSTRPSVSCVVGPLSTISYFCIYEKLLRSRQNLVTMTMTKKSTIGKNNKEGDAPSPANIISSSHSRFCDKEIPRWLSYVVTFIVFPLNMMLMCLIIFIYGLFCSDSMTIKTLLLIYAGYILFDRNRCDGKDYPCHRFPFSTIRHWIRNNWLFGISTAYHPIRLHKTAELPAVDKDGRKMQYFFTCHPHGVISVGTWSTFASDEVGFHKLYPGIHPYIAGIRHAFFIPFFRDWCLLAGCVSAGKACLHHILGTRKESVAINLGGAAEAFMSVEKDPKTGNPKMKLLMKDRKGFCKIALQHGVNLVPVISLEEQLLFDLVDLPHSLYKIQVFLQKYVFGIAPVIAWGNKWPLMPKRQEVNVFVGKPISCKKKENPSQADIDAKHEEYCQELEAMFYRCRKKVKDCENWEIELVEHPAKHV